MSLLFRGYCFLLMFLFNFSAYASMIEVSPVQLYLSSRQAIGVLRVTNRSDENTLLQMSLFNWYQSQGKDIYQRSHDILMTPPLFRLPAHTTQVVRFALRIPSSGVLQKTYRMHIKEVYQHRHRKLGQELYFLMDISLPLFIQPERIIERFVWSSHLLNPRHVKLRLYNDGNVALFINQWQLLGPGQRKLKTKQSTFVYILPHQSHNWVAVIPSKAVFTDIQSTINGQTKKSVLHKV